jgi:hypothetical protein
VFRRDVEALEIHKAIAALGMFNVTNQYTFASIFRCAMGAKGDVAARRAAVTDMILRYLRASPRPTREKISRWEKKEAARCVAARITSSTLARP